MTVLQNQSNRERSIKVVMSTKSVYYTGKKAHLVKKGVGEFVLKPFERKYRTQVPINHARVYKGLVRVLDGARIQDNV